MLEARLLYGDWQDKMANTFVNIQTQSPSGSSSSLVFSSIPGTYQDLVLKWTARDTGSNGGRAYVYFNTNAAGNKTEYYGIAYDSTNKVSTQNINNSAARLLGFDADSSTPSNVYGIGELSILNYASSSYNKAYFADSGMASSLQMSGWVGGLILSNTAITTLTITAGTTYLDSSSVFSLYGLKKS